MTAAKRRAFRAIREVIGDETCTLGRKIKVGGVPPCEVEQINATAHQLRHALAALLVLHLENPERCPNCGVRLPKHVMGCHLADLLRRTTR